MDINFHGMKTKAVNYKGVQIIQNSLNGGWMLFFEDGSAPLASHFINDLKRIVDKFPERFIKENTYKEV